MIGLKRKIVKILTLTSEGLGEIEMPDEYKNDKELTALALEQIVEILFSSITPLRDRFEYDFEKELTFPPKGEVIEFYVSFPEDLRIKDIDVDWEKLDIRYFDTFFILMSNLSDKLLEEAGIEPLS